MLFYVAIQQQRNNTNEKEALQKKDLVLNELYRMQSILLKESLLKQAKKMKKELKRKNRLMRLNDNYIVNESENQDNNITLINSENSNFKSRNNSVRHVTDKNNNINYENNHRRYKSKKIKNKENSKINYEKIIKNESNCPICLDKYKIESKIAYLPCFHFYHSKCIKKWLKYSKKCPLCKKEFDF